MWSAHVRFGVRSRLANRRVPATFKIPGDVLFELRALFSQQRFVPKRNCHPRSEEVLDLYAATPPTWLSDLQSLLQFVWKFAFDRLLPAEVAASVWITGCGLRAPIETGVQGGEQRRCP